MENLLLGLVCEFFRNLVSTGLFRSMQNMSYSQDSLDYTKREGGVHYYNVMDLLY